MAQFDSRSMIEAAASSSGGAAPLAAPRQLAEAAAAVAAEPVPSAMSPIVLAGAIRMIEFALVAAIGTMVYAAYVVPMEGISLIYSWHYFAALFGGAALATLASQSADIYQVQAFRGYKKQYFRLASAWSVVFLVVIGTSFFLKAGDLFSRIWLAGFYFFGLLALLAFRRGLFLMVRRWTQEGRLNRRTAIVGGGDAGEELINALKDQRDT